MHTTQVQRPLPRPTNSLLNTHDRCLHVQSMMHARAISWRFACEHGKVGPSSNGASHPITHPKGGERTRKEVEPTNLERSKPRGKRETLKTRQVKDSFLSLLTHLNCGNGLTRRQRPLVLSIRGSNSEFRRQSERGGWLKVKVIREITAKEVRIKDYGGRVLANKLRTESVLICRLFWMEKEFKRKHKHRLRL
ncbi:unnamed protein product [Sphenostylis stenocarpa]|uniref:Uncharacterized protein n=1 Tax=Sphenostylis stenocarpa TaxID=92480 RepID=A0AA86SR03_9FABA|nr:unnamed protein product [Sphenostylis stenocarpa]